MKVNPMKVAKEEVCLSGPSISHEDVINAIIVLIHLCSIDVDTALALIEARRLSKIMGKDEKSFKHDLAAASGLNASAVDALIQVGSRVESKSEDDLDTLRKRMSSRNKVAKSLMLRK
jgi:hypothetical protein